MGGKGAYMRYPVEIGAGGAFAFAVYACGRTVARGLGTW